MTIQFNVKVVFDFLVKNGYVYTVRKYSVADNTFAEVKSKYLDKPKQIFVKLKDVYGGTPIDLNCSSDLSVVANESGFDSVEQWIGLIKIIHKQTDKLYLLKATIY